MHVDRYLCNLLEYKEYEFWGDDSSFTPEILYECEHSRNRWAKSYLVLLEGSKVPFLNPYMVAISSPRTLCTCPK